MCEVFLGDFVGFQARNCENKTWSLLKQFSVPNPAKSSKRQSTFGADFFGVRLDYSGIDCIPVR